MPIEENERAADKLHSDAGPEGGDRERRLEDRQALDMVLHLMLLQVPDPGDDEQRDNQQPPRRVEPRDVGGVEAWHSNLPRNVEVNSAIARIAPMRRSLMRRRLGRARIGAMRSAYCTLL